MINVLFCIIFIISQIMNSSDNPEQFLNSLTHQQSSQKPQQISQQNEQKSQEEKDIQGLHFIQSYYGNPKYQKAMAVLHDQRLQAQYEEVLHQLQMNFFEYTNQVLQSYHTLKTSAPHVQTDDAKNSDISSFFNMMKHKKTQPIPTDSTVVKGANSLRGATDSSDLSFLNSLKKG